jgi:hypothetical protein
VLCPLPGIMVPIEVEAAMGVFPEQASLNWWEP